MLKVNLTRNLVHIWAPFSLFLLVLLIFICYPTAKGSLISWPGKVGGDGSELSNRLPDENYTTIPGFDESSRRINASELLSRPLDENITTIPKIFHQSWLSDQLPTKFQEWSMSCRTLHSDWEWVLWTDEDNLNLVRTYFPWLEKSYLALPAEIYRADLARSLYMYIFGGIYADLDTECLQSSESLFDMYMFPPNIRPPSEPYQIAFFGRMGDNPEFEHSIPNAWMAATPGHPVFLVYMNAIDGRVREGKAKEASAEALTGPVALRESIVEYETGKVLYGNSMGSEVDNIKKNGPFDSHQSSDHKVVLLPSHLIYPYSWGPDGESVRDICWVLKKDFSAENCKEALGVDGKRSISITYWSHTHTTKGPDEENISHVN